MIFFITKKHKKLSLSITFILLNINVVWAQSILENYIEEGIKNNETIKQQTFELNKNLYALKQAKSLFFPVLSLEASYFKADGGRTIDMPVGDLLNPVFSTLNQLSSSQAFGQISNMSIQLNPDDYYDAKFRLAMPLYNTEISYNYNRSKLYISKQQLEILLYKRELVKNIKVAYYQYCQTLKAVEIRENSVDLVKKSSQLVQSLYKNGKSNYTNVLRSEGEIKKAEESLFSIQQTVKNSKAYFNFLLNKPFDDEITIEEIQKLDEKNKPQLLPQEKNINKREEIQKIKIASSILQINKKAAESYYLPKVETFLDLGLQGFNWEFNDKSKYYMFGISLKWNFSLGGGNQHKINQSKEDINIINSQNKHIAKLLELQLNTAQNSYEEALNSYESILVQYNISQKYFSDVTKLYKEGIGLYIELLEAQNQYTNTYLRLNIAYYDIYIKQAEVERANASFNLPKIKK